MAEQDAAIAALCEVLTRLSRRTGLTVDRLRTTEVDVAPLLSLPVIHDHSHRTGAAPQEVATAMVRAAARGLPPTDRLIADAALRLGLLRKNPPDTIDLNHLYAPGLNARRAALLTHWTHLHDFTRALHTPPPPATSALRARSEPRALTALAHLLVTTPSDNPTSRAPGNVAAQADSRRTRSAVTTVSDAQPGSQHARGVMSVGDPQPDSRHARDVVTTVADPQSGSRHTQGVVTVVGEAVLEHIYRVGQVPPAGSSTTGSFQAHPGGKGLNHAVAAARLGLEVRLVAAVGDDEAGRWIRDYLRSEHVGAELVRVVPQARTPVTAVMVTGTGAASTIGCREEQVRSGMRRLGDTEFEGIIAGSDAVLLTFDQPMVELERVLTILRELETPPVVVMQPSPRIDNPQHLYRFLRSVDYLVGTPRQLARMLPEAAESASGDPARRLRSLGVRAVCEISDFGCTVDSEPVHTRIPPFPAALRDSPGAHSAFAAALMRRVLTSRRPATEADYRWATAAMVAAQSFGDAQGAMPSAHEIDRIMRLAG